MIMKRKTAGRRGLLRGRKIRRDVIRKSGINRLTGSRTRVKSVRYVRKVIMLCAGAVGICVMLVGGRRKLPERPGSFTAKA